MAFRLDGKPNALAAARHGGIEKKLLNFNELDHSGNWKAEPLFRKISQDSGALRPSTQNLRFESSSLAAELTKANSLSLAPRL